MYTEEYFPTVVDEYVRPGTLNTEFRGFPFIGQDSVTAYRFLLAAGEQDKLWDLQEAMYRNQGGENDGWVTDELIRELGSEIAGLDVDQLFSDAEREDIVAGGRERRGGGAGRRHPGNADAAPPRSATRSRTSSQFATVEQLRAALDDALAG